jgi:hypothetical protein
MEATHSSAASLSNRFTCSLASLTAALAVSNALSASRSAASALKTLSLAFVIDASSWSRWSTPRRGLWELADRFVCWVVVVAVGEGERWDRNSVLRRRGVSFTAGSEPARPLVSVVETGSWVRPNSGILAGLVGCGLSNMGSSVRIWEKIIVFELRILKRDDAPS